MNLINIRLWNQAAIAKTCWDLFQKTDKLWIRWIHSFYIKIQHFFTAPVPKQASWMVKKIFNARLILEQTQKQNDLTTIGSLYLSLLGNRPRVPWKGLMFTNSARPKAIVTMWLQIQNKLPTSDRLASWGMDINQQCTLCQHDFETRDHLFVCCEFTRAIWRKLLTWIKWSEYTTDSWDTHTAQFFKLMYTEYSHAVWIERNRRVFEGKSRSFEYIAIRRSLYV
ncbi:hypothetical protein MTR67_036421 [Solanum verrucosum]|uniref:Reverse transcriptase zinc-binding domain-containing protein n=1 Tax=Solanum verrucosum TaxID=315347 RepID=A0AAF0ZKY1_SOLVR|nr:hypothetical protein MTR67_036421 [Solanum verrucosum]